MRSVESHTTKTVCIKAFPLGFNMGLWFYMLYASPFWVKAPTPACYQGADLISCLLAYMPTKKKTTLAR